MQYRTKNSGPSGSSPTEWRDSYIAAVLETDWTLLPLCIRTADFDIAQRQLALIFDSGDKTLERLEIAFALAGLNMLREDLRTWQESVGSTKLQMKSSQSNGGGKASRKQN